MEVEDGGLLPVLEPAVAGDQGVVLVGQSVARRLQRLNLLAAMPSQPIEATARGSRCGSAQCRTNSTTAVAGVVGNPELRSEFPKFFF